MARFPAIALFALSFATPAAAQPVELPDGRTVEWTHAAHPQPARYRSGDLLITIRGIPSPAEHGYIEPEVTVVRAGRRPQVIRSIGVSPAMPGGLSIGRLDRSGRRYVMWQAQTGGAHCCIAIHLILPDEPRPAAPMLGNFDMEMLREAPGDVDGDGAVDFVLPDDRFNYRFASFAASFAPLQIFNIVGGRRVDVSRAPRYRALFLREMESVRDICRSDGGDRNGACASWVAMAARIGRFDEAWREMLPAYERGTLWGEQIGCRVPLRRDGCPQGQAISRDFPTALRRFLARHGYLRE